MEGLTVVQMLLSVLSGSMVGFSLGLIGSGGSILAVPLLIYLVGFDYPHMAIGTTALSVAVNAFINIIPHARKGNFDLKAGAVFSTVGVGGVLLGNRLGLLTPGSRLLFLFGGVMIAVAVYMLKSPQLSSGKEGSLKSLALFAFLVGLASGYFGIGGGFLIAPALMYAGGLDISRAIGTSLFSVGTFGTVTALSYYLSGQLNLEISLLFIAGGVFGGWGGARLSTSMPKDILRKIFAAVLILAGLYVMYRTG
ncbi:MAG: sulfite exporter TauE/SafE family protein [Infirmifilum sp.]